MEEWEEKNILITMPSHWKLRKSITDEMVKDAQPCKYLSKLKFGSPDQTLQDLTLTL
jgi:hypothetical protein